MAKGVALEWSHGRVRTATRGDEVPALPAPTTPALHAPLPPGSPPTPGRKFAKDNKGRQIRAEKERQAKERAKGIATLNPATAPAWLRPHLELGAPYIATLRRLLEGKEALHPLAGDVADAHVMFRALLDLAAQAEGAKERGSLLAEARGWLKEHRTALATLSKLAGDLRLPEADTCPPGFEDVP